MVRPIGGVVLSGLQQSAEVQHGLDEGIVEVLLDNLPPELDVVHAEEHIAVELLPVPSVRM